MNEDYLWDKTGSNADIEKLEIALHAFSHTRTAPPQLPARVLTPAENPRGRFFRLGFALAFATAIVVAFSSVWFLMPDSNKAVDRELVNVLEPQRDAAVSPVEAPPDKAYPTPTQNVPTFAVKARTSRPATHLPQTIALKFKNKQPTVKLTDEEKYAYGQLMLALSITGSKLKIVRDTIAGTDDTRPMEKGRNLYQK